MNSWISNEGCEREIQLFCFLFLESIRKIILVERVDNFCCAQSRILREKRDIRIDKFCIIVYNYAKSNIQNMSGKSYDRKMAPSIKEAERCRTGKYF